MRWLNSLLTYLQSVLHQLPTSTLDSEIRDNSLAGDSDYRVWVDQLHLPHRQQELPQRHSRLFRGRLDCEHLSLPRAAQDQGRRGG